MALTAACGDDGGSPASPDAPIDADDGCDPTSVLPSNFRPIAMVSTGQVQLTASGSGASGTVDGTAGGLAGAADNPYVYVDLAANARVDINDLEARTSDAWDVAFKRASVISNGGTSGTGGRTIAIVQSATIDVTAPASGYAADDYTSSDCALETTRNGEPLSAFGEWYLYDEDAHTLTPKPEVYVLQRPDGSRTAIRIVTYYGDPSAPTKGAFYSIETKPLPDAP